jgi:antirestriction protein ArdC
MSKQSEIREHVTQRIVAALEHDLLPWRQMWSGGNGGQHFNASTGKAYRGVNVLLLSITAMEYGFQSTAWATFNQWKQLGCRVNRRPDDVLPGQWGATICVYIPVTKKVEEPKDVEDEEEEETFWILKKFTVFNADQVSGATAEQFQSVVQPDTDQLSDPDFEPAEQLIAATGADIRYGGGRAFYSLAGDFICLPPKTSFIGNAYYATALHELAHWSECRLGWDREKGGYPMGELIAEMAACFLATELGIPNTEPLENHASYLKSWLSAMREDDNYIFKASRQASKVCDFLLSFVKQDATEPNPELVEAA